jgi:RES domain-containing protein
VITSWRIVKAEHVQGAFDGEGARLFGGRWNSRGARTVYTAQSIALAALEMLVHLGRGTILTSYVTIGCTFSENLVLRLDRKRLPPKWRSYPAVPELAALGDAWLRSGASAVLEVPSAIVTSESNYLLNPSHHDFKSIQRSDPTPFEFDLRLLNV